MPIQQIQIIQPGILSTLQDEGRTGFRSQAVPVSGAMDLLAARMANLALGNDPQAAVVEFTYANASFFTLTDVLVAYAGEGAFLQIDKQAIPAERPVFIPAGKTVSLVPNLAGCRTYLAVAGGWDVPLVLGSRSTYITAAFGGFYGRALQNGDVLSACSSGSDLSEAIYNSLKGNTFRYPNWSLARQLLLPPNKKTIRVIKGKEAEWFDAETFAVFLSSPFKVATQSNRMGYRLEGSLLLKKTNRELLSTAVVPGTVQLTGSGNPILLMVDCQTTGGYPRIVQVAAVDLPLCGQLKPGDTIHFEEISCEEAEMLYFERERQLAQMVAAINQKFFR